jgi:hypothetical protein
VAVAVLMVAAVSLYIDVNDLLAAIYHGVITVAGIICWYGLNLVCLEYEWMLGFTNDVSYLSGLT